MTQTFCCLITILNVLNGLLLFASLQHAWGMAHWFCYLIMAVGVCVDITAQHSSRTKPAPCVSKALRMNA